MNDVNNNLQNAPEQESLPQKGASLVEYALLVALIAVVAIAGIRTMGQSISTKFSGLGSTIRATS